MTDQQESVPPDAVPVIGGIEVKKLGYSLYLRIPDDKLDCRCSYVPRDLGAMMTRDELLGYLNQNKVMEGIDQEAVDGFIVKAAAGIQQVDVLIASGIPPVSGEDEYLSLAVPTSVVDHKVDDDNDDDSVDMHIVQTFINVSAGDEIGRIIPAGPGTPGRDIMGRPIPPQPGNPMKSKIGKNILIEDNGALLKAEVSGRLCQSAGEIAVEEEFIVKGDVNFRVGSLDFKGVIEVRGDVLDNFDIVAGKGLAVSGNIGVCKIVSDGDISFCGMDGQESGSIFCGGTVRANFIHDVVVECKGDVIVGVEIHNCVIRTLGRIVVDKGAISGGTYIAQGGIEAKKLGSPSSLHTKLVVGVDYRDIEELEKLFATLAKKQVVMNLSQSLSEIAEMRKSCAELSDRIMAIRGRVDATANAKINAKAVLYENVQMTLGSVTETINEQKDGPLSVIENSLEGGVRFLSLTSLDVKAVDIDMAFVREQKMALRNKHENS